MRRSKLKSWGLILAVALPGSAAMSCSGTAARELRDAALAGASSFVTEETFNLLDAFFPERAPEE